LEVDKTWRFLSVQGRHVEDGFEMTDEDGTDSAGDDNTTTVMNKNIFTN
jgi:hypothetical protein